MTGAETASAQSSPVGQDLAAPVLKEIARINSMIALGETPTEGDTLGKLAYEAVRRVRAAASALPGEDSMACLDLTILESDSSGRGRYKAFVATSNGIKIAVRSDLHQVEQRRVKLCQVYEHVLFRPPELEETWYRGLTSCDALSSIIQEALSGEVHTALSPDSAGRVYAPLPCDVTDGFGFELCESGGTMRFAMPTDDDPRETWKRVTSTCQVLELALANAAVEFAKAHGGDDFFEFAARDKLIQAIHELRMNVVLRNILKDPADKHSDDKWLGARIAELRAEPGSPTAAEISVVVDQTTVFLKIIQPNPWPEALSWFQGFTACRADAQVNEVHGRGALLTRKAFTSLDAQNNGQVLVFSVPITQLGSFQLDADLVEALSVPAPSRNGSQGSSTGNG